MLILTRKSGESSLIGNNIKLTVKEIDPNHVKLSVNDSENITVGKLASIIIADGVKITVKKINKGQVKLGIRAPESMAVSREEVYKKEQVENEQSSSSGVINHIKL